MDISKKKLKKLKKKEASDIGEHGDEIIKLNDDKFLEKEGEKKGQDSSNTKKKNRKGNLNAKNMDIEAEVEGEDDIITKKAEKKKKNNKDKKNDGSSHQLTEHNVVEDVSQSTDNHQIQNLEIVDKGQDLDGGLVEKAEKKKKKKDNNKRTGSGYQVPEQSIDDGIQSGEIVKAKEVLDGCHVEKAGKKKKRKRENEKNEDEINVGASKDDQNGKQEKQKKKVKFSDKVEIFQLSDNEGKLVRGKRFSREEDEIVKKAVYDYIEAHSLGEEEEGLNMILNCKSHPEVRNCWKEIALAIPYRPRESVYNRAQILFRRSETSKWTKEEYEQIKEFQKKHGNQWNLLAEDLHKHRRHIKDTWRRIKLLNTRRGHWNQEEYQSLFDLVNLDLKTRYNEEKKSKHGMLRDNICWGAISDNLSTRSDALCCMKWYKQLTSSMVVEGEWVDTDDYRLINALYELDASCIDDVDWDNLIEHRSGDVCRKRWTQMSMHIGYHGTKSFSEQVEVLAKRYCPDLIEVREVWDKKPVVD